MAIALNGGHAARALDFYKKENKFFILGGTAEWSAGTPDTPRVTDFKLNDIIGLQRVSDTRLVIKDNSGDLDYNGQKWKRVSEQVILRNTAAISQGSTAITVSSLEGLTVGSKVRIRDTYEGIITAINTVTLTITLDTPAPSTIANNSRIEAGALVEGAKYVYVNCTVGDGLPFNVTYRQIGLCTGVIPEDSFTTADSLLAAAYSSTNANEFKAIGTLEVLDNRKPTNRDEDQSETLSMIIEF